MGSFRKSGANRKKHIPAPQAVVLNEGESSRQSQSLLGDGEMVFNNLQTEPPGWKGLLVAGLCQRVPARAHRGGAWAAWGRQGGRGVAGSIVGAGGASGVEGAGRQSSDKSMPSSLSGQELDISCSESRGAQA